MDQEKTIMVKKNSSYVVIRDGSILRIEMKCEEIPLVHSMISINKSLRTKLQKL